MYNNSMSSIANLPPKHRFLQKFTNEVKRRHLQPDFNVPNRATKHAPPSVLQEITLKQLFQSSLELKKKQKENISPKTPSEDGSDYSASSHGSGTSTGPSSYLTYSRRGSQSGPPRVPLPSLATVRANAAEIHHRTPIHQYPNQFQQHYPMYTTPASGVALAAGGPLPQARGGKVGSSSKQQQKSVSKPAATKKQKTYYTSNADVPNTNRVKSSTESVGEQPYCCIIGCRKPVNNRLRHSLKTYTIDDCDPEFVAKKWDRICSFHYFRDNYLHRKSKNKRKRSEEDSEGPALKKKRAAGIHDEEAG